MITHVITFKMKDGSPEHVAKCVAMLESMRGRVPSLRSLEVGVNLVDVATAHHFVLITTFDDLDGLQAYQDDPVHLEVARYLREHREMSASVDFER